MRGNEFLDKMDLVDPMYVEAADSTTVKYINKRKIALLVAAVMLVLLATGWIYAANIPAQFKISKSISLPNVIAEEVPIPKLTPNSTNEEYGGNEHLLTRLPQIAEQYGVKNDEIGHYRVKNDGEYFIETGSFFTDDEAFAFFFTNDNVLETENHVYVILYNEQKDEYKYEHQSFINIGSYTVTIQAVHGWSIIGSGSYFFSETTSNGGGRTKDIPDYDKQLEIVDMLSEEFMRHDYEYRSRKGMEIIFDMS